MPHPIMKPVKVTRGRARWYFPVMSTTRAGRRALQEIAMTCRYGKSEAEWPILPLVTNLFPCFGYYVFSMPVTSLENQIRASNSGDAESGPGNRHR